MCCPLNGLGNRSTRFVSVKSKVEGPDTESGRSFNRSVGLASKLESQETNKYWKSLQSTGTDKFKPNDRLL